MTSLSKYAPYGTLFIRLLVGFHLIYGRQDNIFSYERMLEFRDFLEERGVPVPLVAAHVSVYAQFIAGAFLYYWLAGPGSCVPDGTYILLQLYSLHMWAIVIPLCSLHLSCFSLPFSCYSMEPANHL